MADTGIPHFCNDLGLTTIEVGSKEFMCIGAKPPFDHPHIFLDLGEDAEKVCPYCSTLYRYNPELAHGAAKPEACVWHDSDETSAAA
ncbi:zinc-finger domain-containing protein [Xanthobacter sediminis]|uniref:zinc-finger domain-containing protein n=1 Tax=Xanthobacter sediminis TaxID=3119926 RepID=UPI0037263C24